MSKQIENNVVQMTFDNRQFENGINESSKSIEKLNEQLKFKDASDGFKDIEKYANSVNFDGLNKAISNINSVFTVTGALTKKIIDDIAGYFEKKIVGAVSYVTRETSGIIKPDLGWNKYKDYTTTMLTMTSNLSDYDEKFFNDHASEYDGKIEYVEEYLSKLALYADETSYSLTDMADTMAKFAASNVNLEKSSSAMMGFANMAAVAGQNSQVATSAMIQLAQAFGTGYIKYQDWMQAFSLKNIATKESKQIFINAAKELGTIDDDDIKQAKRELGENWQNWFFTSDQLNQGWLKTDTVLVKGLREYSKASDLILDRMEEIGDVSVTDILSWTEEFQDSGKSVQQFAQDLASATGTGVKDATALAEVLDKLSSSEYELSLKAFRASQMATNFSEAIDAVKDAVGTKWLYVFKYLIGDLDQARHLWTNFSNSLWDVFAAPLDNTLEGLEKWNKELSDFTDDDGNQLTQYEVFWESIGSIFTSVGSAIDGLIDQFRILAGCFENVDAGLGTTSIIAEYTFDFMSRITSGVKSLSEKLDTFLESDFYKNIQDIFMNIIKTVRNVKKITTSLFEATVGTVLKNIGGPLTAISEILVEISQRIEMYTSRILNSEAFNTFIEILTKITTKLMELGTYLIGKFGSILLKIVDKVWELAVRIANFLLPAVAAIFDFIDSYVLPALDSLIDGPYSIGSAIDYMADALSNIIPLLKGFIESVTGMSFDDISSKLSRFVDTFVSKVSEVAKSGFGVLGGFLKDTFNADIKGSLSEFFKIIGEADSVAEGAEGIVRWSGDALSRPVQMIFNLLQVITGIDLSKVSNAITGFIKTVANALGDISPTIFKGIEIVFGIIIKVLTTVGSVVVQIIKYLGGVTDTTGFKVLDMFLDGIKTIFSLATDLFASLLGNLGKIVNYITPGIEKVLEYLVNLASNLAGALKKMFGSFEGMKDPQKFLSYVIKLAAFVVGIFVLAKVGAMIYKAVRTITGFSDSTRMFGEAVERVSTSFSGLLDTLAGNSMIGIVKTIALLLISFGYALSGLAKAGEALSDKNNLKGALAAFAIMIVMIALIMHGVKAVGTAQVTMYKEIEKTKEKTFKAQEKLKRLQKKHGTAAGSWFLSKKDQKALGLDTESLEKEKRQTQETLKGIGSFLIGIGIAVAGISLSVALLAKVSKSTSQEDLTAATSSIAIIILFLAIAAKIASGVGESEKVLNKKDGMKIKNSGQTFKGLASALLAFAAAIVMISIPLAVIAVVSKLVGLKDMIIAIVVIGGLLAALTFMITKISKFDLKFAQVIGVILIFNTLALSIIAIAGAFALLTFCIKLLNKNEEDMLFKTGVLLVALFSFIIVLFRDITSVSDKVNIKDLTKQISALISIATIMITLVSVVSIIVVVLSLVSKVGNIDAAMYSLVTIGLIIATLMVVLIKLTSIISGEKISSIFKLASLLALLIVSIAMVVSLIGIAGIIAKLLDTKSLVEGAIILLVAFGILSVIVKGMISLINFMNNTEKILKNIVALVPIITIALTALTIIIADIVLLSLAVKIFGEKEMSSALYSLMGMVFIIGTLMVIFIKLASVIDQDKIGSMFKIIGALVAITFAISLLSATLIALSAAIKLLGLEGSVGKALLILGGALLGLVVAVALLGEIAKIAGPPIGALAKSLGIIMLVVLATIAVIFLFIAGGDKLVEWLETNSDMIRRAFFGIGKALADMLTGLLTGINEVLPELLEAIAVTITTILNWIESHVKEWAMTLVAILAELLVGIGEGIEKNKNVIAEGITKIITGLWHVIVQVVENFSGLFEKKLEQWFGNPQEELHQKMEDSERKHQEEMYKIRQEGAEMYIKLLEDQEKAEEALHDVVEAYGKTDQYGNLTNTADIARAQQNLNAAKNAVESKPKERWSWYDVDPTKSSAQNKAESKYMQDYDKQWDYAKNKAMDAGTEVGEAFGEGVDKGVAKSQGTNSPSKEGGWLGEMFSLGFLKGANGEGTGSSIGNNVVKGFKAKILGIKDALFGGLNLKDSMSGMGTDAGEMLGGNVLDGYNNSVSGMDFSNVGGLSQDSYHLDNYDDWQEPFQTEMDLNTNLNTTVTNDQLGQVSSAVDNGNDKIVNAVNELRDKFDTMVSALNNAKVVMDTGETVGVLAVPMDKALGNLQQQRARI